MVTTSVASALMLVYVQESGWKFMGGRQPPTFQWFVEPDFTHLSWEYGELVLYKGEIVLSRLSGERMFAEVKGDLTEADGDLVPRNIRIKGPIKVKQQRKKSEGGGWHEVEHIGILFSFARPVAQARYDADVLAKKRLARDASHKAERAKQDAERQAIEQARAEHARYVAEYVSRQQKKLQGLKLEDLRIEDEERSVTLVFTGGVEFTVVLCDREDPFDVHTSATLAIISGDEQLS